MVFDIVQRIHSRKRPYSQLGSTDIAHVYFDSRLVPQRNTEGTQFVMNLPDTIVRNAGSYQQVKIDNVGFYNNLTNLIATERTYEMRVWNLATPETKHLIQGTLPDYYYTFDTSEVVGMR